MLMNTCFTLIFGIFFFTPLKTLEKSKNNALEVLIPTEYWENFLSQKCKYKNINKIWNKNIGSGY